MPVGWWTIQNPGLNVSQILRLNGGGDRKRAEVWCSYRLFPCHQAPGVDNISLVERTRTAESNTPYSFPFKLRHGSQDKRKAKRNVGMRMVGEEGGGERAGGAL